MISSTLKSIDTKTIFESLNTPIVVFNADDPHFTVLAENSAHANLAKVERDDVIGRPILKAFPDTSKDGVSPSVESIRKVIRTGNADSIINSQDSTGRRLPKYRNVIHYPIFENNQVIAVYQETKDNTDIDEHKHLSQIQAFLADASKELSSSLNYQKTLKKVTRFCVPEIADWCSIDLYDEEKGFEQVSIAHADPKKISLAKKYRKLNPVSIDQPTGVPNVIRTGKSEFYPYIADELLEQYIDDPKVLEFMKSLNLHSIIISPIHINDKVVGGISFVSSDSGRYYTDIDLHMAEELAARISLAITNSKLYADSVEDLKNRHKLEKQLIIEKQRLESRVKERTEQLQLTNAGLREEIRKRHVIEDELKENTENLRRSNAELEEFAYIASHDLQEPLRKIQAFSNLLESEYSEKLGEGADYVGRMNSAASRMSTLIQDLLAFSRVTSDVRPPVQVELREIVTDVLMDLEASVEDCKGTVVVGSLPSVLSDPTHMRQLFQNLIGNALKFHSPDHPPLVEITANTSDPSYTQIYIKDDGIGFDEKYLDKIFSVFQRLHNRDTYDGTGIGLAVCRKIVERYDGTITAESVKNKGTTFIVRLPCIEEKAR